MAAGVAALYGPLHGGANEQVLRMLRRIEDKANVPGFIAGVKDGKERLMGFGHRVYKTSTRGRRSSRPPRATCLRSPG